jgi:hypothetical protein
MVAVFIVLGNPQTTDTKKRPKPKCAYSATFKFQGVAISVI